MRPQPPVSSPAHPAACYRDAHIDYARVRPFDNVQTAELRPSRRTGRNIFFHETTCLNGTARLRHRQACAIESAARANPLAGVFVLFASPAGHERGQPLPELFARLAEYRNVHMRTVDLWQYARDTPAEAFVRGARLFGSAYPSVHAADLLRLLSLHRFGGTHLDLDVVVRGSLAAQPPTFVAEELDGWLSNAVLALAPAGLGHWLAALLLAEFAEHFDGEQFAANGPALLKRVVETLCRCTPAMKLIDCQLLRVEPKERFFPVYGTVWQRLFDWRHGRESLARASGSLAVHMWNALSAERPVRVGERSAYEMLAREFCPRVFGTVRNGQF